MLLRSSVVVLCLLCVVANVSAQSATQDSTKKTSVPVAHTPSKWYDKLSIRGYSQFRHNRLLETNENLKCEQCDRSIGKGQSFSFRRARLILSGNIHERVFLYVQFDYSSDASETNKHFLQVRDAYADVAFDKKKKEFRLRFGQSKVPYGFENLQSSSNRLPLDRADALNSAAANERDFGGFFYYAPEKIRERYKILLENGLKGSGDYGVFGIGLHNGQTANKPELNNNLHAVARLSYPFKIGRQIIEPGIQGYAGKYTVAKDRISSGTRVLPDATYDDKRVAGSFVLYPQPFGIQAEYNVGKSPTFDAATDSITLQNLRGGYVTASYRTTIGKQMLIPFVRYQVFEGAKKHETDARKYDIQETEIGAEWTPIKNLEITLAYVISRRKYTDLKTDYDEKGQFLRLQMQLNY
jgi:hypothetical protein